MSSRRVQPSRAAKNKPAPVAPVSTGRVTKKKSQKKTATMKKGLVSKKKKGASKKTKTSSRQSKRKTAAKGGADDGAEEDAEVAEDDEGDEDAAVQDPPTQAAGADQDANDADDAGSGPGERRDEDLENRGADQTGSGEGSRAANGQDEESVDDQSYEDMLNELPALATSEHRTNCDFRGDPAELALSLKIFSHPVNLSRPGYYAKLRLTVHKADGTDGTFDGSHIGFIHSWRISKPTRDLPLANDAWLDEILSDSKEEKDGDMKETAFCLSALFRENGTTKPVVGKHTTQLNDQPLMFIEMIYINPGFLQAGLLTPVLECFYRALAQLPEWFAFSGTLLLVPAKPDKELGESWGDMKDDEIQETLMRTYRNRGFEVWAKNAPSRGHLITVMGRTTP